MRARRALVLMICLGVPAWSVADGTDLSEQVSRYLHQRSIEDYLRARAVEQSEEQIARMVEHILKEGVEADSRVVQIITRAVIAEAPGGKIGVALYDSNWDAFRDATAAETAKQLTMLVAEEGAPILAVLSVPGTMASALGSAAGGDWRAASRTVGRELISKVPVLQQIQKVGDTTSEVMNHLVKDWWLDPAVEQAFEVYRDEVDKHGYRGVERTDEGWDLLRMQMGPMQTHLSQDFIREYCRARPCDSLEADERREIIDRGFAELRNRFEERIVREPEIERSREVYKELFSQGAVCNLLLLWERNPLYREGDTLETLMARVIELVETVKQDTDRSQLVKAGEQKLNDRGEDQIETWEAAYLASILARDGREAYLEKLLELRFMRPDDERVRNELGAGKIFDGGGATIVRGDPAGLHMTPSAGEVLFSHSGSWEEAYGGWRTEENPPNAPYTVGPIYAAPGVYRITLRYSPDIRRTLTASNSNTGVSLTHRYPGGGSRAARLRPVARDQPSGEASTTFELKRPGQIDVRFMMAQSRGQGGGYQEHAQSFSAQIEFVETVAEQEATAGARLLPGDTIRSRNRPVIVSLRGGIWTRIERNSSVSLEEAEDGTTRVIVERGRASFRIEESATRPFEVVTANGTQRIVPVGDGR